MVVVCVSCMHAENVGWRFLLLLLLLRDSSGLCHGVRVSRKLSFLCGGKGFWGKDCRIFLSTLVRISKAIAPFFDFSSAGF